ncbi:MAG TPA: HAD-IB family phosphatase [Opitutaceae bacterium]
MKLICFDCDSTLSSIEGIDELARLRGSEVLARVESMTRDAMDGTIPIEQVFGRRLEAIRPTAKDVEEIGRRYVANIEPTAAAAIARLAKAGWTPVVISAGFVQAIRPLAGVLGISRIEAVELRFSADGSYLGYDTEFPSTRTGGKREIIGMLRQELRPEKVVMVGDGVSDLETAPAVDLFIAFGRYVARERVRLGAGKFVTALSAVPALV